MAQRSGRIACPRCGANNFDTVTQCWKCGTALTANLPPVSAMPAAPAPASRSVAAGYAVPALGAALGNSGAANRAAIWLGLLLPYFGLPIGLAFMMCDDRRRQEVGRICILWSLVSLAAHLVIGFVSLLGLREYVIMAVNAARGASRPGGAGVPGLE